MDASYWDLFWRTGMPEAWLMSRDGAGPEIRPGTGPELGGPMASSPTPVQGDIPGSCKNIY